MLRSLQLKARSLGATRGGFRNNETPNAPGAPGPARGTARLGARPALEHWALLAPLGLWLLAACTPSTTSGPDQVVGDPTPAWPPPIAIPPLGTDATLDVVTWNLLHFGSTGLGPTNEILQLARIRDVILGTDADLWAVQEVTRAEAFRQLLGLLPGYQGILASDSVVASGSDYYHASELKVGLIYKSSVVSVTDARLIATELDREFAGRPPLEVRTRLRLGGADIPAVVIVLHAKATSAVESWERRMAASAGLLRYLEDQRESDFVLIPGDFNDDIDESITEGRDTPYRNFLDARPHWTFATEALTQAQVTSILGYDNVIDHILVSDEAMARYEEGSAQVYCVDDHIADYENTTSDHLPVLVRFTPPGP